MDKLSETQILKETIRLKALDLKLEEEQLKLTFQDMAEDYRPINIVKRTIRSAFDSNIVKNNLLGAIIGVVSTIIDNQSDEKTDDKPLKKLTGKFLRTMVSGIAAENPNAIKSLGNSIIDALFSKKSKTNHVNNEF
jgi:hypothetical protein